jgi:hypothetical protein
MPRQLLTQLANKARRQVRQLKTAARYVQNSVIPAGWEYLPNGWETQDPSIQGWVDPSILDSERKKWPTFQRFAREPGPLTLADNSSVGMHNNFITFGYVLALAAHQKTALSMLDWGGGLGHYSLVAKALMPGVTLDYHCKDVKLLAEIGPALQPHAKYYIEEDAALARAYDFVMANDSLMLSRDWSRIFGRLAKVTREYLYVALPVVIRAPSFVVVQRAHQHGFNTSFMEWFLNRDELLELARSHDLELKREFLQSGIGWVHRAPEQGSFRGFLFRKKS